MPRHHIIRVRAARQYFDALAPFGDRWMILADVETEFFDRIKEISDERYVRDSRPLTEQEIPALEPFVDDAEIAVDAPPEKRMDSRPSRRIHPVPQKTLPPQASIDRLIAQDAPAQSPQLIILAA